MAKSKPKTKTPPPAKPGKSKPKVSKQEKAKGKPKPVELPKPPVPPSPEEQAKLEAEWANLDSMRRVINRLKHGMPLAGLATTTKSQPTDGPRRYYLCNLPPGCKFKLVDSPNGLVGAAGLLIKVGEGSCKVLWLSSRERGKTDSIARMTEVNFLAPPDKEQVSPETVLESVRAEQRQEKEAKKAPKVKAPPPVKDTVGNRQGSQASQINAALSTPKRQTLEALVKATGLNKGRLMGHIKYLRTKGKLDENKAGTEFRLKK